MFVNSTSLLPLLFEAKTKTSLSFKILLTRFVSTVDGPDSIKTLTPYGKVIKLHL